MTEQEDEPRVYNAAEVFNFEDEMTGRAGLDWHCIDGTTRSYIELDTGKDYGTDEAKSTQSNDNLRWSRGLFTRARQR